jgi:hypothetical protein
MLKRALLLSIACSCSGGSSAANETVAYQQLVEGFPDLATCLAMTEGELFNCTRSLTLCSNGGFELVVTDIVNEGLYTVEDRRIVATLAAPGDAPETFTFVPIPDGLESPELGGTHPWRPSGTEADQLDETCAALEGRTWWPAD